MFWISTIKIISNIKTYYGLEQVPLYMTFVLGDENCISSPVTYGSQPEGTKETMAGPEQLTEGQTYSVIVVGETESDWLTGLTSVSWHATFTPPSEKTVKLSELEAE